MIQGKIDFQGKTESDVEFAIEEALRRIRAGNTSGHDRNEDGMFEFELSGEAEPREGDE